MGKLCSSKQENRRHSVVGHLQPNFKPLCSARGLSLFLFSDYLGYCLSGNREKAKGKVVRESWQLEVGHFSGFEGFPTMARALLTFYLAV